MTLAVSDLPPIIAPRRSTVASATASLPVQLLRFVREHLAKQPRCRVLEIGAPILAGFPIHEPVVRLWPAPMARAATGSNGYDLEGPVAHLAAVQSKGFDLVLDHRPFGSSLPDVAEVASLVAESGTFVASIPTGQSSHRHLQQWRLELERNGLRTVDWIEAGAMEAWITQKLGADTGEMAPASIKRPLRRSA